MRETNRFQDFFEDPRYAALKNYLYNYLLRKRGINKALNGAAPAGWMLEAGSGLTPIITDTEAVVYSELSFLALKTLKQVHGKGRYVAADVTRLPFKSGAFARVVCSEVLEHVPEDRAAVRELARMVEATGLVAITFPHRNAYFAFDDRFVHHFRRYELAEMAAMLEEAGLHPVKIQKVLGPLEKVISLALTHAFAVLERRNRARPQKEKRGGPNPVVIWTFKWANRLAAAAVWLDARLVPRRWSTVLLLLARKNSPK